MRLDGRIGHAARVSHPDHDQDDEPKGEIHEVTEQVAGGQDRLAIRATAPIESARPKMRSDKDSIRGFGGRIGPAAGGKRAALSFLLMDRLSQDGVANP